MARRLHLSSIIAPALLILACCAPESPAVTATSAPAARHEAMAAAADPRAVDAALEILAAGGNAVDAAIAAELVLGLVEPQSSGIGGGGFLLFFDAASKTMSGYDGRERAPAGARPDMFIKPDGQPMAFYDAQASGVSIGVPLLVPMLKMAHDDHGQLPWKDLFQPAIRLAEEGFAISPLLARFLALPEEELRLRDDPASRAYFFDESGVPWPAGHVLRNPDYATTLRALAEQGPEAMQVGRIAHEVVNAARRQPRGGALDLDDLTTWTAQRFTPLCMPYRAYKVCTAAPPSSANAMLAILGLYERARPTPQGPDSSDDWSAFLWASRLAYADRDHYMADPDFGPMPTHEIFSAPYLDERAAQISVTQAPKSVRPGAPGGPALRERWGSAYSEDSGTTHLSIVDQWGNAVALTATIESLFGAQRMAGGFLLNNELTDFSFVPTINGLPVANAVAAGKRPRSSMSPTIVTEGDGELALVIGSPGGSGIIGYVARATIGILDWGLSPQEALNMGNAIGRFDVVEAEPDRWPEGVGAELSARGWRLAPAVGQSGLHAIRVTPEGLEGGADPRGEGIVGVLPASH
jgi:gamma-glutamyltranspeptidase/glutathione hydrolase